MFYYDTYEMNQVKSKTNKTFQFKNFIQRISIIFRFQNKQFCKKNRSIWISNVREYLIRLLWKVKSFSTHEMNQIQYEKNKTFQFENFILNKEYQSYSDHNFINTQDLLFFKILINQKNRDNFFTKTTFEILSLPISKLATKPKRKPTNAIRNIRFSKKSHLRRNYVGLNLTLA